MIKKIANIYNHIEEYILVACILIMVVVTFTQVVLRYVLNSSLPWSEELVRILFIWISWIGLSFGQKRNEHIKITMVTDRLKGKVQKTVLLLADIFTLAIVIVLLFAGIEVTSMIAGTGTVTPALQLPKAVMYASVPISCGLMAIRVVKDIIFRLTGRIEEVA